MGREKRKRSVYVLAPEVPTFVATRATKSRIHQTFIEAPPVTEEQLPSDTPLPTLGSPDSYMADATISDPPVDASGYVELSFEPDRMHLSLRGEQHTGKDIWTPPYY
ncbi:hypothetical protein PC9H_004330 [Pleurotus ostreatus]|uniref:Uncharacterized protein n=1 Tax=Pleurotus ostreatus TaxID=5322 RepID=A0A8H7A337_PLEOS|nr:uncharacterized protein PC9H_004330 [Pleurotus ostreatus]KAF7437489.1 hypothetical protein PC9H_004330 [Pleurotus ostreatus]